MARKRLNDFFGHLGVSQAKYKGLFLHGTHFLKFFVGPTTSSVSHAKTHFGWLGVGSLNFMNATPADNVHVTGSAFRASQFY